MKLTEARTWETGFLVVLRSCPCLSLVGFRVDGKGPPLGSGVRSADAGNFWYELESDCGPVMETGRVADGRCLVLLVLARDAFLRVHRRRDRGAEHADSAAGQYLCRDVCLRGLRHLEPVHGGGKVRHARM